MMRYEWKKLFERRLNRIAMLLGYLLIGVVVMSYITQERCYDAVTDSYVEGLEAIKLEQKIAAAQTDVITEAYMTELIREIQNYGMDLESDEAYAEIIRPLSEMFWFAAKSYTDMRDKNTDLNALNDVELTDGARYYESRIEKITNYLNLDFSYGNYTEAEKSYWLQKAAHTKTPFRWGSTSVMSHLYELTFVGLYLLFVIVIAASSVFSAEYETGAAYLLLTTKYGKDRLVLTKVAVLMIFTIGYLTIGMMLAAAATALIMGLPGADLPVQLWNSVIPYNITLGQTCFGELLLTILIGVTLALVLLCCSAGFRSSPATMVVGAAMIIAPAFFPMSRESGLWNHINYLFPVRAADLKGIMGTYISYAAGDVVIPYVGMVVIVYTAVSIVALLAVRRAFVRKN